LYSNPIDYRELLADFGLEAYRMKLVSELSGGERQKLSVLLALIPNPELVFLDELTTGLDSKARRDVWKHLIMLKEKGLTILLTSHYMDEVENLCDRVCILKKGQMLVMNTVPHLIAQSPFDNFEEAYLWYTGEEKEDEDISDNV
jgi:ABC-2 type transport system ATP-binding protein